MLENLRTQLTALCTAAPFATGLAVDVGGEQFALNADYQFSAASIIKLGIAAYGHDLWTAHQESLTALVEATSTDIVGGAGLIRLLTPKRYPVADLLTLMITVSDNTATNLLIDRWGMTAINDWLQAHYLGAQLERRLMAPNPAGENLVSATAALHLLQDCLNADDAYWQVVQRALRHQTSQLKLTLPLASGEFAGTWANKTGELADVEHDAARLMVNGQHADCVLLTQFAVGQRGLAMRLQRQIGECLCQYLNQ
jgi:beta-lactamase class A